jgi:glycosyltransferase involved in cell wall biosynthesis
MDWPNIGSRGERVLAISQEFERAGHEVTVAVPLPLYRPFNILLPAEVAVDGVSFRLLREVNGPIQGKLRPWTTATRLYHDVRKILSKEGIGCVIMSQLEAPLAYAVIKAGQRGRVPVVTEYMDIIFDQERTQKYEGRSTVDVMRRRAYYALFDPLHNLLMRRVLRGSSMIWVISDPLIDEVKRVTQNIPILKVPPLVRPSSKPSLDMADPPHATSEGRWRIVFAGQCDWPQGVDFVIATIPKILEFIEDVELVVAGSNCERLRHLAKAHGVEDKVTLVGYLGREELRELMRSAAVLIAPKVACAFNDAGFATKVIDYMLTGRPVVAAKVGEQGRVLQSGRELLLFEPGDAESFVAALRWVWEHPADAAALGRRGQEAARTRFDPALAMKGPIQAVTALVEGRLRPDLVHGNA